MVKRGDTVMYLVMSRVHTCSTYYEMYNFLLVCMGCIVGCGGKLVM